MVMKCVTYIHTSSVTTHIVIFSQHMMQHLIIMYVSRINNIKDKTLFYFLIGLVDYIILTIDILLRFLKHTRNPQNFLSSKLSHPTVHA